MKQGQLIVGNTLELYCCLVVMHHGHAIAGHPGIQWTTLLTSQQYWWPKLREFVKNYIKGCATC
jgi:hypothetical protein